MGPRVRGAAIGDAAGCDREEEWTVAATVSRACRVTPAATLSTVRATSSAAGWTSRVAREAASCTVLVTVSVARVVVSATAPVTGWVTCAVVRSTASVTPPVTVVTDPTAC
jgi:hypothetical protein